MKPLSACFLLSFFFFLTGIDFIHPQTPREFSDVVAEIAKRLVESNKTGRPQRLAVITFLSTKEKSEKTKNEFGEYITESLITELGKKPKTFRLFERGRLDIVLRENDLMLSDLMDQSAAMKVGELIPIDVIFSGTYTRLKSYIDVNSRLIDVVTGEIVVSFSGRILMTDDLASLFGDDDKKKKDDTKKDDTEGLSRCDRLAVEVRTLLNDLTTTDKINAVAKKGMAIPFTVECSRAHYDIMGSFGRHKIMHDGYKRFVMKTLDTIPYPAADERAAVILRFFASDSIIDEEEWRLGLQAVKRMNHHWLRFGLLTMLRILPLPDDLSLSYRRIDEYFSAARSGKVGLPVALSFTDAFFYMTEAVNSDHDNRLARYCYEQYGGEIKIDKKSTKKLNDLLVSIYENEKDRTEKSKQLVWLADFYNQSEPGEDAADMLYAFINFYEWEPESGVLRVKKPKGSFPLTDLETFIGLCKNKLSDYAILSKAFNIREKRIDFCAVYGIPVPGVIPTMDEAREILAGDNMKEQLRILPLLEKMSKRPASLENELVALLKRKSLDQKKDMKKIHTSALVILANTGTTNVFAIDCMVESLTDDVYMNSHKAKDVLTQVGAPAVPFLVKKLKSDMDYAHIKRRDILTVLARLGKKAISAKSDLQVMLKNTTDKDLKYSIEAVLQAME